MTADDIDVKLLVIDNKLRLVEEDLLSDRDMIASFTGHLLNDRFKQQFKNNKIRRSKLLTSRNDLWEEQSKRQPL
jgi:hypothetical protein